MRTLAGGGDYKEGFCSVLSVTGIALLSFLTSTLVFNIQALGRSNTTV
jgi:hypothetical protein